MEHCRPNRPGDTTGIGRIWTDQGLARNGGDQPTCVLVAGQTVGSGNKGIGEAERCLSVAARSFGGSCKVLVVACPLKGPVRRSCFPPAKNSGPSPL